MGNQGTWVLALAQNQSHDTKDPQHLLGIVSHDSALLLIKKMG